MTETLENPVIKDEISDDAFLEAAAYADRGEEIPADLIKAKPADSQPANTEEQEPVDGAKPDNSETTAEKPKVERPRDELGRFTKTETGEDIPENERKPAEQTEARPESAYTKAQKERERQENLLKNFQQEKEQARAEIEQAREQLRREAAELQRARAERTAPQQPQPGAIKYSSRELLEAADEFDKQAVQAFDAGDGDLFKKSLETAKAARQQAGQVAQLEAQAAHQAQGQQFQATYVRLMDQVIKAEPDLAKADSLLAKDVQALLEAEPVFSHIPDGFPKAVQVVKWKRDAGVASELRETNKKLQAEVDRLNGLTQVSGSGPTSGPAGPKSFENMTDEQQEKYLMEQAAKIDSGNN